MNYVFFDIECANCLHGEGKICSFGYVKTDENFNVIKKKDILMDPAAPFLLGNARTGNGIRLAYPLFRFRWAHTFPSYYHEIRDLLEDKDSLAFGFAVLQDASYLLYSCKRYQLTPINFKFYDIQLFEKELHHLKNPSGLDTLVEKYHEQIFTYHRSDDDALMTMEVLRSLLKENNYKVEDVLSNYPAGLSNTKKLIETLEERRLLKNKKEELRKRQDILFSFYAKRNVPIESSDISLYKKNIFLTKIVLNDYLSLLEKNRNLILKKGAKIVRCSSDADILVLLDKDRNSSFFNHCKKDAVIMTMKELLKKLGIKEEESPKKKIRR